MADIRKRFRKWYNIRSNSKFIKRLNQGDDNLIVALIKFSKYSVHSYIKDEKYGFKQLERHTGLTMAQARKVYKKILEEF